MKTIVLILLLFVLSVIQYINMMILTTHYNKVVKTTCTTSVSVIIQIKAIEQYFKEALFYTRYCNSMIWV